jgi:hypothetical protein
MPAYLSRHPIDGLEDFLDNYGIRYARKLTTFLKILRILPTVHCTTKTSQKIGEMAFYARRLVVEKKSKSQLFRKKCVSTDSLIKEEIIKAAHGQLLSGYLCIS